MIKTYFIAIGVLIALSVVPFMAYITIPLGYLITLFALPTIAYKRTRQSYNSYVALAASTGAFLAIYYPVFGDVIQTYARHRALCAQDGGIAILVNSKDWQESVADKSQLKLWMDATKGAIASTNEGAVTKWINTDGRITRTWANGNKRYTQKLDAFYVEEEIRDLGLVTQTKRRIVDQARRDNAETFPRFHRQVLLEMTNYRASDTGFGIVPDSLKFWMPAQCAASMISSNQRGLAEQHHDGWAIWFDLLLHQYATEAEYWY